MEKRIVVLGAGLVGKAIAIDLAKSYKVTSADIDQKSLESLKGNYNIDTVNADLSTKDNITNLVKDFDLVISAVPGFMGYDVLQTVIEAGKNIVDISFMPEDFMELNNLANEKGVAAITDCGVAPGIPNLVAGYYNEVMDIENFEYYVGGLPKIREYPFYYKAPFSPIDVVEEYTRPARYVEKGQLITKPAMSNPELMFFENVGTLEAFDTDGLRSLLQNLHNIPNMKEKTLRFPGHIEIIKALKTVGFFDHDPVTINNTAIRPIDYTSKLLIKNWELKPGEPEFTVMRIIVEGKSEGQKKSIVYDLYDEYCKKEQLTSMARTTGFVATASAEMLLKGLFKGKGVFPLELIGKEERCFNFIFNYQEERNINYKVTEKQE